MNLRPILALACMALPAPALAADKEAAVPVEERDVASGKVKLDPARGYIFVHGPARQSGLFLRVPDQATIDAYQQDWEKALAKAQKRYLGQLKSWEASVKVAQQTRKPPPPRPDEPTRETFTIEAIELRDYAPFGPMFVYSKADEDFAYLTSVKPGTYIWYGPSHGRPGRGGGRDLHLPGQRQVRGQAGGGDQPRHLSPVGAPTGAESRRDDQGRPGRGSRKRPHARANRQIPDFSSNRRSISPCRPAFRPGPRSSPNSTPTASSTTISGS